MNEPSLEYYLVYNKKKMKEIKKANSNWVKWLKVNSFFFQLQNKIANKTQTRNS